MQDTRDKCARSWLVMILMVGQFEEQYVLFLVQEPSGTCSVAFSAREQRGSKPCCRTLQRFIVSGDL